MEEIMIALKNIQKELDEQKSEIRKSADKVTERVTQNINKILEEKFLKLQDQHDKLKEKVENQEKRIYFLEKQARQRNVVFFGIEEKESSYDNLQNNIVSFIKKYFNTDIELRDIQEVRRVGKKGDRPRPIIVIFSTLGIKINIMKNKGLLKDTQYYLKEDYPLQVLKKRRELLEQAKIEKEKGNDVRIKYDKLVILKSNNKRSLPTSPENTLTAECQSKNNTNTQAHKKNRTQKSNKPVQRSNSLSEGGIKPSMLNFLVNKNINNTTTEQKNDEKTSSI
ncbi:uncharacterized protein LOC114364323 [Ostrinia furnacalis]|uniref:uncharacterized protein LOC114364323 n=1 Tax=Ostrinia furnacalis TaxID=93504 RepID=UPI00103FE5B9|nr:uncharacterized protein LOC114364323 [Ostrinia furnacalis]